MRAAEGGCGRGRRSLVHQPAGPHPDRRRQRAAERGVGGARVGRLPRPPHLCPGQGARGGIRPGSVGADRSGEEFTGNVPRPAHSRRGASVCHHPPPQGARAQGLDLASRLRRRHRACAQTGAAATLRLRAGDSRGGGGGHRRAWRPRTPRQEAERNAVTLVIVGATSEPDLEEAVGVFIDTGFQLARWLSPFDDADEVLPLRGDGAVVLKDADARGIKYVLVHVGSDDGKAGGSHDRAHHPVDVAPLRELAQQLKSRERMLITCLAFGYKRGIPEGAAWVVDVRLPANPYWADELRPLAGRHPLVREFVLAQPAAKALLANPEP